MFVSHAAPLLLVLLFLIVGYLCFYVKDNGFRGRKGRMIDGTILFALAVPIGFYYLMGMDLLVIPISIGGAAVGFVTHEHLRRWARRICVGVVLLADALSTFLAVGYRGFNAFVIIALLAAVTGVALIVLNRQVAERLG